MTILIASVVFAIVLDLKFGDPRNKYHPTFWVGTIVGRLVPLLRSNRPRLGRVGGIVLVTSMTALVSIVILSLVHGLFYLNQSGKIDLERAAFYLISVFVVALLLKTTIAIRGMEKHASEIMQYLSRNDLEEASASLARIVKRNTKGLDRPHVISATIESMSENIVDGITGPLFYFAFFGLVGAFVYRTVNTIDSMVGYKNDLFRNLGWFGANCDKVLNFMPSRFTGLVMVLATLILGHDWKHSLFIMKRDATKTESPNAGYPMATMAGALGVRFEKIDHYVLGEGLSDITVNHFRSALSIMRLTAVLFAILFTIPIIVGLSYLGWWIYA